MPSSSTTIAGKYQVLEEIGVGGMASVHLARIVGPAGFSRFVAVKQMHGHLAKDPKLARMFLEEGRVAGRIHHPNVVATLDVLLDEGNVYLVLEYVRGESLARLLRTAAAREIAIPVPIACAIVTGALNGLQAAHEEGGDGAAGIVHRDVSPENVLVGTDGVPRVLDFGIAKAVERAESTASGGLRGKLHYMAPEQLRGEKIDRRVDIYAAGVVLWEAVAGRRLFDQEGAAAVVGAILAGKIPVPSHVAPRIPSALDAVILRALSGSPAERFESALEMAHAIETVVPIVSAREVGAWVDTVAGDTIRARSKRLTEIELDVDRSAPGPVERKAPADQLTAEVGEDPSDPSVETVTLQVPLEVTKTLVDPPRASAPSPSRRSLVLVLAALAVLVVIGVVVIMLGVRRGPEPVAPPDVSITPPPSTGAAAASAPPSLSPTTIETATHAAPLRRPPVPSPRKRPPEGRCNPPYVIEADGTKRYRPECL